mmetsp:Transcript_20631/g.46373  ORF Transcript_20631/g.46373 Transcript_20631/m.46373 type:complete len:89 (+) Transcript_20631:620-886(+)
MRSASAKSEAMSEPPGHHKDSSKLPTLVLTSLMRTADWHDLERRQDEGDGMHATCGTSIRLLGGAQGGDVFPARVTCAARDTADPWRT